MAEKTPSPQPLFLTVRGANVPILRFPEFSGAWQKTKIGAITSLVTSGSRDWSQHYSEAGDKFIRMTNLPRSGINLLLDDMKYVKLPVENTDGLRTSLQYGDILISITAELGKIGWVPPEFGIAYINQHTALVRLKQNQCSKFIAYLLSSQKMNKKINRLNDSGAKSGLNLPTIRSIEFFSTSANEQQKVADFLTAVDTKIQQLKRKHDLMQQYKKGVMQQLFSQQVRFKDDDGRDYPDWEEDGFGSLVRNKPRKYDPSKAQEDFPCVELDSLSQETGQLLQTYSSKGQASIKNQFQKGNVLFGKLRPYLKKFWLAQFDGVCSTEIWVLAGKEVLNEFLLYLIQTQEFQQIANISSGSKMPRSDWEFISNYPTTYPCMEEQKKIAGFLAAIDAKIQQIGAQIEKAETFKKGLLQQMFV
jgi:type I restriction enzyme S subunit